MQLAVVVPVKDRERYVEILLRELPTYLERVNLIRDYTIYVAEQIGEDVFNLALSRNVGAAVALADGGYDYFVFQDVDVVPVTHVDYRFLGRGEAWFLTAGGCKLLASDLVRVN